MLILWLIVLVVLVCFGAVLAFGAPYLPTLTKQMDTALDMIDLQAGETLLELGCGDGKVLLAAAERGWKVVGIELNPLLVIVSWLRTRRYRAQVQVRWGNFWAQPWPPASGIFVFVLPRYMRRLDAAIQQKISAPAGRVAAGGEVKLVSFAFEIPDKKPVAQQRGVYLYSYRLSKRSKLKSA